MYNIWYGYFQDVNHDKCDEYKKRNDRICCQLLCVYVILLKYHVAYLPNNTELIISFTHGVCTQKKENRTEH